MSNQLLYTDKLSLRGDYKGHALTFQVQRHAGAALKGQIANGLVRKHTSFGYALANPFLDGLYEHWDDPYTFVWFIGGWGDEWERYAANAVRKLRASLRTKRDTLDLRANARHLFEPGVESANADGDFPWGDFTWGGATFVNSGGLVIPTAVSALDEDQDDWMAKSIGGFVGTRILHLDGKLA